MTCQMAFAIIAVKLCNLYIAVVLYNIKIKFMGIRYSIVKDSNADLTVGN